MPDLLPAGYSLALNTRLSTLALLWHDEDSAHPTLVAEAQFSDNEMGVLVPLLQQYPNFCPYEILLANFYMNKTDEAIVDSFRLRLQEAMYAGVWDHEMRPVRNILSRVRFKLRDFSLEINSILETGYILIYSPDQKKERAT
jgi:hypothetical protein